MKVIYKTLALAAIGASPLIGNAQAAVDLYNLFRPDLRGTAVRLQHWAAICHR